MTATQTPPVANALAITKAVARPEATTSPPTIMRATPTKESSAGDQPGSSQVTSAAQQRNAAAAQLLDGGQTPSDIQRTFAVVADRPPAPARQAATAIVRPPGLVDPLLILAAEALDDLEATRIANENRLRSLRDVYGLAGSPQEAEVAGLVDGLKALEHQAELALKRAMRRHPLMPWVDFSIGVGEKQGARLLAAVGDPYWNGLHDRARTVSELWAYCGYHVLRAGGDTGQGSPDTHAVPAGVAPARARGQKANWNPTAKSRAWLVASSCIKQANSPYRRAYDDGRAQYADAIHQAECRRCGPVGHPAAAGTPLSLAHQHARALRLVAKTILRDLWIEARRIHEGALSK